MANRTKTECSLYRIVTLLLVICTFYGIGADDLYRCPQNLVRNRYLRTWEDRCYQFIHAEKHWFAAKDYCVGQGGSLITIERRDIQAFVERSLNDLQWDRNGLWIGATDDHREHDWRWVNGAGLGAPVSSGYTNWDRGQPSCFLFKFLCREDCACLRLDEGFQWHDYFCRADGFEYSFVCQYQMLPATTTTTSTTTTTTTTTTERPTTTTSTTKATTPKVIPTTAPVPSLDVIQASTVSLLQSDLLQGNGTMKQEPSSTTTAIDPFIQVESQRMMSKDKGMQTGSVVGMVVSFVLIFIAGICVGVFLCRRRYKKRYEESASQGFNNVLYVSAPQRTKDTNLMAAGVCVVNSDDDGDYDADDHRYCDIAEVTAATCYVKLPNKDSGLPPDDDPPPRYSTIDDLPPKYCTIEDINQEEEVEGGACGGSSPPPPPCGNPLFKQFTPEFLSKDTDVSEAYSNNLYGYTK